MVRSLFLLVALFTLCRCGKQITLPYKDGDSTKGHLATSMSGGTGNYDVNGDDRVNFRDLTDLVVQIRRRNGVYTYRDIAALNQELRRRYRLKNTNPENCFDTNNDYAITIDDALEVIVYLRTGETKPVAYLDVNVDGVVSEQDAKDILAELRRRRPS